MTENELLKKLVDTEITTVENLIDEVAIGVLTENDNDLKILATLKLLDIFCEAADWIKAQKRLDLVDYYLKHIRVVHINEIKNVFSNEWYRKIFDLKVIDLIKEL